jgi:purine-binding chemotaxis protein CheW
MKSAQETGQRDYVTVLAGGQLFGLPIQRVHDVFVVARLTRVPLAPPDVAGVLNLRGRIVTAVDLARRLGLEARAEGGKVVAVGVEHRGESFGLIIDRVGEVLSLKGGLAEANPSNLDRRWAAVSSGICRLDRELLVVLDVDRLLLRNGEALAA